jgi:hypothetical protein
MKSPKEKIILNGECLNAFLLRSGIRQECLLSGNAEEKSHIRGRVKEGSLKDEYC